MTAARRRGGAVELALVIAVVFSAAPSHADRETAGQAEGRLRWKKGQDLYKQKKYLDAAREFELGYAAAPRPLFLLNIGHSYRRGGDMEKAKDAYEKLLELEPNLPQRGEVEGFLRAINDVLGAKAAPVSPPPVVAPYAPPAPVMAMPPSVAPPRIVPPPAFVPPDSGITAPPLKARPSKTDEASDSFFRKPLFWVVVAAAVGASTAGAIVLMRPAARCQPGAVGCP